MFKTKRCTRRLEECNNYLLHKKGEREDISNYRPISLLSVLYKVFIRILADRFKRSLDEAQPREQAGFRAGYSTMDYIFVLQEIVERTNEYEIPVCLAFIDYEKAFDSVMTSAVLNALANTDTDSGYVDIFSKLYSQASARIRLHKYSEKIKIGKRC